MCIGEKKKNSCLLGFSSVPLKIFSTNSLPVPRFWIHFFLNVKDFVSLVLLKLLLLGSFLATLRTVPCFFTVRDALQTWRAMSTCCILHMSLPVPTHKLLCQGLFTDVFSCAFCKAGSALLLACGKTTENNLSNG